MEQKPKMFALNNFVPTETNGRLSSLSVKRDLSLGGNKLKRVYKPNLNASRVKGKGTIAINYKIDHQTNRKTLRGIVNRTNHQRYVQSGSVFSEGAGDFKKPTIHSDRSHSSSHRDQTLITMPKIIKKDVVINNDLEESVISELLGENDNSSEEETEFSPIVLPLKHNRDGFIKAFQIKKEEELESDVKQELPKPFINNHTLSSYVYSGDTPHSFQNKKLYNGGNPCISLLRLPDSLPGRGYMKGSEDVSDFNIREMAEGKIGKILVRQSGKIDIQLGSVKFLLDCVEENPFKEELMSISKRLKSASFGPDMISLGNIEEKYVLSPCWKDLFSGKTVKKKK